MQSINKVTLIGNITADPQIRTIQNGQKVAGFTVATSERWKDKTTGETKESSEFNKVVVFNPNVAGVVESMCQKGTRVYIEGTLKTRKWQNQQGQDVYTTEVVLQQFGGQLIILSNAKQKSDAPEQVDDLNIDIIPF
jgi:single-strand DNA-binding protein